ncbi:MAG: GAF domain-containing protein [Dehalococcoidia bacterium]
MSSEPVPAAAQGYADPADLQDGNLYQAIWSLTSELSLEVVLQKVADLSRALVGAAYSAIGVLGDEGKLRQFITSGIDPEARRRIGNLPEGKGVLGVVLREGKALRLQNLSQHPEASGFPPNHPAMSSFLGVPIVYKGRVLGDLYLTNKIGAEEFSQRDQEVLTLFAAQAAVAMENARLFQSEARRSVQLDTLNRVGRELTGILDLDTLLQRVAELLRESFEYQNVQVFWIDRASDSMQVRAVVGVLENQVSIGDAYPLGIGTAGWVARNRKTWLTTNVSTEAEGFEAVEGQLKSELAVPVIVKEATVAVIDVNSTESNAFDASDVQTLETLADQLAVAVENIHLYQQQRDQFRRLAVVEERDRIGRDLHDGVIQSIYAVGLTLEDIAAHAEQEAEAVGPRIEQVVEDLNQVITDIRSYIMELRPRELQGREPVEALASLIQYLEDRSGVCVTLNLGIDLNSLSERYMVNLWHIFQESFSNIEKYAQAQQVYVSLVQTDDQLDLKISDDGVGFDPERAELDRGYGLPNIKDRAERLEGVLRLDSSPGQGTRLHITIPVDPLVAL